MSKDNEYLLNEVVKRIISKYDIIVVILFGSRARGDWGPWSDYDLLIIGNFRVKYIDRIREILELMDDIPLPVEPHPYTIEEAINLLKKGNPTIVDALEEGKILYSNDSFNIIMDLYNNLKKKGLKRTSTSIIVPRNS